HTRSAVGEGSAGAAVFEELGIESRAAFQFVDGSTASAEQERKSTFGVAKVDSQVLLAVEHASRALIPQFKFEIYAVTGDGSAVGIEEAAADVEIGRTLLSVNRCTEQKPDKRA